MFFRKIKDIIQRNDAKAATRLLQFYGLRRDGFYPLIFSSKAKAITSLMLTQSGKMIETLSDEFVNTLIDHVGELVEITAIIDSYSGDSIKDCSGMNIPDELKIALQSDDYYSRLDQMIEDMDTSTFQETLAFIAKESDYTIHCGFALPILKKIYQELTSNKEEILFLMAACLKQPFDITLDVYKGYPDFVRLRGSYEKSYKGYLSKLIISNIQEMDDESRDYIKALIENDPAVDKATNEDDSSPKTTIDNA